jgi:hypothetical protein
LPRLLRLTPWLAAAPVAGAAAALAIAMLPLLTWTLLTLAVLAPVAAGALLFNLAWE